MLILKCDGSKEGRVRRIVYEKRNSNGRIVFEVPKIESPVIAAQ